MIEPQAPTVAPPQWVTEADLKGALERLSGEPIDRSQGLFGPDSLYWEINRHTLVYFPGAVRAVQMQLAHPWIAQAIFEHSKIMTAPRKRAQLTYIYLWSIIYGDFDMAAAKSLSLYRLHSRVQGEVGLDTPAHPQGSRYAANEAHALLWVHVTAFYTRVRLYERIVRPLRDAEKDRFCGEAVRYALCFGIPPALHPANWAEVEAYVAAMQTSGVLARTDAGLRISRFLRERIPFPFRNPLWTFLCAPLPAETRALLDLPGDSASDRRTADRVTRLLAAVQRALPSRLATVPAWQEARLRLAGRGADRFTMFLNRAFLGVSRLVSR